MNREQWKAMLPIITAFVEGKTIQVKEPEGEWQDILSSPDFSNEYH